MIEFQTDENPGYRSRTIKNASADVTIAIAIDFTSAGEKLTKKAVLDQGKLYLPVPLESISSRIGIEAICDNLSERIIYLNLAQISLNIAGNGMYRLKETFLRNQKSTDFITLALLERLISWLDGKVNIVSIRTGGQTGFDEAGAKAGVKLGIPTLVYAPKDWDFRDIDGNDFCNEIDFKKRYE